MNRNRPAINLQIAEFFEILNSPIKSKEKELIKCINKYKDSTDETAKENFLELTRVALTVAAVDGFSKLTEHLLKLKQQNKENYDKETLKKALKCAVEYNRSETVSVLLDAGADFDDEKRTLLIEAVDSKSISKSIKEMDKTIKILINAGYSVNRNSLWCPDLEGRDIIYISSFMNLLKLGDDLSVLQHVIYNCITKFSIKEGSLDSIKTVVRRVIEAGADLNRPYSILLWLYDRQWFDLSSLFKPQISAFHAISDLLKQAGAGAQWDNPKDIDLALARKNMLHSFYLKEIKTDQVKRVFPSEDKIITEYCQRLEQGIIDLNTQYQKDNKESFLGHKEKGIKRSQALVQNLTKAKSDLAKLKLIYELCFMPNQGSDFKSRVIQYAQNQIAAIPLKQTLLILMNIHPSSNDQRIKDFIAQEEEIESDESKSSGYSAMEIESKPPAVRAAEEPSLPASPAVAATERAPSNPTVDEISPKAEKPELKQDLNPIEPKSQPTLAPRVIAQGLGQSIWSRLKSLVNSGEQSSQSASVSSAIGSIPASENPSSRSEVEMNLRG